MPKLKFSALLIVFMASLAAYNLWPPPAAALVRDIVFPVMGQSTFHNDFYAPRFNGQHNATDIIAARGTPLLAVVEGTITDVQYPQPVWGYSITITDDDGFRYRYIHMNDDTPGTDDGKGGGMGAYAADMKEGNRVARGQLVGWVGDSGYSNNVPHLHFEIFAPNGKVINPYQSLLYATRYTKPKIPGRVTAEILPFGRYFSRGANVAMGNLDADVASEFAVAPSKGGNPVIMVYQDNETLLKKITAFNLSYQGGVDVAFGDVDGDGTDEIIAGAALGSSRIRVFEPNGAAVKDFYAFGANIKNGVRVAAGDLNGDLKDEIIVGLSGGAQPWVRAFDVSSGDPVRIRNFLPFSSNFRGGVDVAAGNVNTSEPNDEIVVSAGPGGDPYVRVYSAAGARLASFHAYQDSMDGGVRVGVGNVRTGLSSLASEIATLPASDGRPQARLFNWDGNTNYATRYFIEEWWEGFYDVAAGHNHAKGLAGKNRRVTVRLGIN